MNEKRTALLTVCLLGAFLLTFSLWAYLKPDDAFSQSERRKLTPKPSCIPDRSLSTAPERHQRRISGGGLCLPIGVPHAGGLHRPRRPAL